MFQDYVRVGAAHAEGRHRGPARPVQLRPGHRLREQPNLPLSPVDLPRRRADVQRPGHHAVPQGEDGFDDPADAGRGLRVADVGLHRSEPQGTPGIAVGSVDVDQCPGLDGIAERGRGAVRLDHVDLAGRDLGGAQRGLDNPVL